MGRKVKKIADYARNIRPFPIITLFHDADAELLNEPANQITFALHREIIAYRLQCMKLSAVKGVTAVLAATQVGIPESMLVVHRHAQANKWFNESYTETDDYEGYVNPKILSASDHNVIVEE